MDVEDRKIKSVAGIDIEKLLEKVNEYIDVYISKLKERNKEENMSIASAIAYAVKEIVAEEIERLYTNQKPINPSIFVIKQSGDKSVISLSDFLFKSGNGRYENIISPVRNPKIKDGADKYVLDNIQELIENFRVKLSQMPIRDKSLNEIIPFDASNKETAERNLKNAGRQIVDYIYRYYRTKESIKDRDVKNALNFFQKPTFDVEYSILRDEESEYSKNINSVNISFNMVENPPDDVKDSYERFMQFIVSEFMRYRVYPKYVENYLTLFYGKNINLAKETLNFLYTYVNNYAQESFWNCFPYALLKEYSPYIQHKQGKILISYYLYPRVQKKTDALKENLNTKAMYFREIGQVINYNPLKRFFLNYEQKVESNLYRAVRLIGNLYTYLAVLEKIPKDKRVVDKFLDLVGRYPAIFRNQNVAFGWLLGLTFFNFERKLPFDKDNLKLTGKFLKALYNGRLFSDDEVLSNKESVESVLRSTVEMFTGKEWSWFNRHVELNEEFYKRSVHKALTPLNNVLWETENSTSTVIQTYSEGRLRTGGFRRVEDNDIGGVKLTVFANLKETKKTQKDGKAEKYGDNASVINIKNSKALFYLPVRFKAKEGERVKGRLQYMDTPVRRYLDYKLNSNDSKLIPISVKNSYERENVKKAVYSLFTTLYLLLYTLYISKDKSPLTVFSIYDNDSNSDKNEISNEYVIIKDFTMGFESFTGEKVIESGIKKGNLRNVYAVRNFLRKSILQKSDVVFKNITRKVWLVFLFKDFYTVSTKGKVDIERYGAFFLGLDPKRGYIPMKYIIFKNSEEFIIKVSSFIKDKKDVVIVRSFGYLSEFYSIVTDIASVYQNVLVSISGVKFHSKVFQESGKSIIKDSVKIGKVKKTVWHFINPTIKGDRPVKIWKTLSLYKFNDNGNGEDLKDVFTVIMAYLNSKSIEHEHDAVGKVSLFDEFRANTITNHDVLSFKIGNGIKSNSLSVTIPLAALIAKLKYAVEATAGDEHGAEC